LAVEDQRAAGSTFFRQANWAVHGVIRNSKDLPGMISMSQRRKLNDRALPITQRVIEMYWRAAISTAPTQIGEAGHINVPAALPPCTAG